MLQLKWQHWSTSRTIRGLLSSQIREKDSGKFGEHKNKESDTAQISRISTASTFLTKMSPCAQEHLLAYLYRLGPWRTMLTARYNKSNLKVVCWTWS